MTQELPIVKLTDGEVSVISASIFSIQICKPKAMSDEEATCRVNDFYPTGISSGWQKLSDEKCAEYGFVPKVTCANDPDREHCVLTC